MVTRREINEYLFYEFGFDLENEGVDSIADNWPFELQPTQDPDLFTFSHGEDTYYASTNGGLTFYPTEGMSVADIQLQKEGADWIGKHNPVSLDTARIGDETIPSTPIRREAIEKLAAVAFGHGTPIRILEGLFLANRNQYIGLVENITTGDAIVVGSNIHPRPAEFPEASSWRRLAIGIGKLLQEGEPSE